MHRFGKILALSAFVAALAFVPHTAKAPNDLDGSIGDVAGADRTCDAEYKKLELEYMNADVQSGAIASPRMKTTLDELIADRNAVLADERTKSTLQKETADRGRSH